MIGLALVTLVSVLAAGIVSTFRDAVDELWKDADAVTAQNNFSPLPVSVGQAASTAQGVEFVGNVRAGEARAFGDTFNATAVDPPTSRIFSIKWKDGSDAVLAQLGDDGSFVTEGFADDYDLAVGSPVELTFANGDRSGSSSRASSSRRPEGAVLARSPSRRKRGTASTSSRNLFSFVIMEGGQTDANRSALERQLTEFPNAKVATRSEFIDNQISGLSSVLNILYVLLALSVVVSLFGIVNTLMLTVFERTCEIGMLRAIGMSRRQVRRMIRHERDHVLIGGALGIVPASFSGACSSRAWTSSTSRSAAQPISPAVAAVIVGILAAIFPARRASRLNVLEALQYE